MNVTLLTWLVAVGLVAFPVLFGYAYWRYRRGDRDRESFLRGLALGGPGFAVLLLQAADRWLTSPVDDVVAVLSLVPLIGGTYALYLAYWRGLDADRPG
ncbi:hypothetical protein [Salarchaeum sp. JOR-1]|uniref:hypothetical protein n=1 Tax=Salarchaeum sp. JOR-1 TaxID=2599399 RepID=UPI001198C942|nr:hypothetical protein [Salarchaeum sp. JOR-1]QDX40049.1 hypothetical protein FQU85_03740 [Salarchaeum sp. JOR-1]